MNEHLGQPELLAYVDDEIPDDERQAVTDHLAACKSCADALDCLKRELPHILEAIRASCGQESPPATWPTLEELLSQAPESSEMHNSEPTSDPFLSLSNGNRSEE